MKRVLLRPQSIDELTTQLSEAKAHGLAVVLRGSGSRPGPGAPIPEGGAVLDLSRLDTVVRSSPADLTLRVQAGLPLNQLDALLAEHGLWFPAAAYASGGTLGGLLASDADSALQLSAGRAREHVLGASCVHGAGLVAKSRGDVVKNVAGYDVARALVGSFGTLGAYAEIALRVFPRPRRRVSLRAEFHDLQTGIRALQALRATQLEPVFLDLLVEEDLVELVVGYDGLDARVKGQLKRTAKRLGKHAAQQIEVLEDEADDALRRRLDAPAETLERALRELGVTSPELVVLRVTTRGAELGALMDEVTQATPLSAAMLLRPALGVGWMALGGATEEQLVREAGEAVTHLRRRARVVVHRAPASLRATPLQVWGPTPPDFLLMERLRDALDPDGVFARGRFVGGL